MYLLLRNWVKMAMAGRLKPLYGSVFETIVTPGSNPYLHSLEQNADEGTVVRDVLDFRMHLDVSDAGLSRTLLQYGLREELSTNAFRDELRQLKEEVSDEIYVLEIGANIGYYTLLEAKTLGRRGHIFAVEPVPRNVELLEKNIELNTVTDRVSIHQLALGPRTERVELHLSEESNWHSVNQIGDHRDSMDIDMMTVDGFLSAQGLSPDQINVVRADLEGFEVELFRGMGDLLASETPLLLFVELHPSFRDAHELNHIIDMLEEHNFTIVSTALDIYANRFDLGWYAKEVDFQSFDELREHNVESDAAVELIVKKGIN
jgi:FkbM family methyltransferase